MRGMNLVLKEEKSNSSRGCAAAGRGSQGECRGGRLSSSCHVPAAVGLEVEGVKKILLLMLTGKVVSVCSICFIWQQLKRKTSMQVTENCWNMKNINVNL